MFDAFLDHSTYRGYRRREMEERKKLYRKRNMCNVILHHFKHSGGDGFPERSLTGKL